jgi:hypothetical protein
MDAYLLLLAEFAISAALSLAVLAALSRPLMNVLRLTCPNEQAAIFWLTYTRVMLTVTPLLFVFIISLVSFSGNPLDSLRLTVIAALGGLLIGLRVIGKRLDNFAVSVEQIAS